MPPRKPSAKRFSPTLDPVLEKHLQFLKQTTGLDYSGIVRIAVADMAIQRGFTAHDEPPPRKKT